LSKRAGRLPSKPIWLHEIKCDGYRMHARLVDGKAQLLTRTGLDWSKQYGFTVEALTNTREAV
jgi:bifunctional non-homologous end joining protein LigD